MSLLTQWNNTKNNLNLALAYSNCILTHALPHVSLEYVIWDDRNPSTLHSWIDSGIQLYNNSHWTIEFTINFRSIFNYQHLLFNYENTTGGSKENETWVYNTGVLAIRLNNVKYEHSVRLVANTDYTIRIELNGTALSVTVNGTTNSWSGVNTSQKSYTVKIGDIKTNDGDNGKIYAYVKKIKFTDGTNTLMDLSPVIKLLDNTAYLYDTISDRYLAPNNVAFTAGPIIS